MDVKIKYFKIFCVLITVMAVCFLSACSAGNESADKLRVVTTLFPQYDFARQITGEKADVTLLLTPGAESHTYEPTPKDILKIQNADIFIYVGGESEVWVDSVLESVNNKKLKKIRLMEYVEPVEEDEEGTDGEPAFDEHIFTSLRNSEVLIGKICDAVCEADAENEDMYRSNADEYSEKLSRLDAEFTEMTEKAERNTVVFGDRFPFAYFARDYGLDCHAAFSGCGSETEASSATISELINIVKKENIPTVFYIEFSSQSVADKIADAAGIKTALLHSCHNISKDDLKNGVTYADLMAGNLVNLSEALN